MHESCNCLKAKKLISQKLVEFENNIAKAKREQKAGNCYTEIQFSLPLPKETKVWIRYQDNIYERGYVCPTYIYSITSSSEQEYQGYFCFSSELRECLFEFVEKVAGK